MSMPIDSVDLSAVSQESLPVVAVFDFDGTITTKDTFVPFLFLAFGKIRVYRAFASLAFEGLLVMLRVSNRDRFKERIIRALFLGESVARMGAIGLQHAQNIQSLVRPAAQSRIAWHKKNGHRLVLVSASLDFYLVPIAEKLKFDDVLCTRILNNNGILDGILNGKNCRAGEKVLRLQNLLGDFSLFYLHSYGDSSGDKEMLESSDHPHWRPFEVGGEFGFNLSRTPTGRNADTSHSA